MSDPFCSVPGVAVRVGYCGQTTARLLVASLRGGAVVASCSGGSVSTPTLVGQGDDNPAQPGKYVAATGVIDVTGLSPMTLYTWSVTCDGQTITGSFTTLPADSVTDYGFLMWTCESYSAGHRWQKGDVYADIKAIVETASEPILFAAHIDDIGYFDIFKFINTGQTDPTTGLYITAGAGVQGAMGTGLAWDYAVGWCAWLGLLPSRPALQSDSRLWLMRNLPLWAMWGDHEIAGDHCSAAYVGPANSSYQWGCCRADYNNGQIPEGINLEAVAESMYEAFCAAACTPPRQAADGGPASQANAQYWGVVVGPVRYFSFDRNKYALPYNACDTGDTHSYGRAGTPAAGTCSGATIPTRTELGVATDTQPTDFLGATQLNDMLAWLDNDEPFKIVFASNGISRHNQPWADRWPTEFDDYIGRASTGLLQNPKTNGTSGYACHLKGDTHGLHVTSYHADGTANGLGGAAVASGELWEICPGTVNGSTIGGTLFNGVISCGGKLRYIKCGVVQGDRTLSAILHGRVLASLAQPEFHAALVQTPGRRTVWSGFQKVGQAGNGFQYSDNRRLLG